MANVSESQLVTRLFKILHSCDLDTTTTNSICRRLEAEFPVEFISSRKEIIRKQIELFLRGPTTVVEQREEEEEREQEDSENEIVLEQEREESESEEKIEEEKDDQRRKRKKSEPADTGSDIKKKRPGGFCQPCGLSPQLQEFLEVSELPKTEVVKRIWSYIRENNLQNPDDKRQIICDEPLRRIFGVESIDMFGMNKALSQHVWSLIEATSMKSQQKEREHKQRKDGGEATTSTKSSRNERGHKQRKEADDSKGKEKPQRSTASNITAPLPLSDALIEFFGTREREMSRAQATKKMWQYIKENELQDPSDRKMVLCDDKLKVLFKVDSFVGIGVVAKLLTSHLIKPKK